MKKRDKYWLNRMLAFLAVIMFFAGISFYNIVQFNNSYMQEEIEEIIIFGRQIEWAIAPYLKNNDIDMVKKYCADFKDEDLSFRIFDGNKRLIAGSKENEREEMLDTDSRIYEQYGKWKLYRRSIKDKRLETIREINVGNSKYYIELSVLEEDVIKSIVEAQKTVVIFFAICILLLISGLFQVFYTLRKCYNKLEDSMIEIANGNLDYPIEIPSNGLLKELTLSIKTLTKRLKNQIMRLTQLEQYKSEFLQNITHEIKTPITAINSAVELLEANNSISNTDKECFDIIQFQIRAIDKLVNDILCLSEIEVEKTNEQKSFQNFDLTESVKETIEYLGYSNINFHYDGKVEFYGNRELLSTAVSNLIINAQKYSKSENVDVYLTCDDDKIIIQVKDYGVGIAPEHLNKIFKRFYRIDKARSRQTGGTGLGLAIAQNVAELHDGSIKAESEINKGATFTITLPKEQTGLSPYS